MGFSRKMANGFTIGNDNPQYEGVIHSPVRENNGVFSYAVLVSQEDAKKIAELFSHTECENKKILYGQEGNLIYVRASQLGTYPDGCDYQGKVNITIRLQTNGWLQPICFATKTAKAKADAEKVKLTKVVKDTVQTVNVQSRAFGIDKGVVSTLTLAGQLGFGAEDFAKAVTLLGAEKSAPKKGQVNAAAKPTKATNDNDNDNHDNDNDNSNIVVVDPADVAGGENSNPS